MYKAVLVGIIYWSVVFFQPYANFNITWDNPENSYNYESTFFTVTLHDYSTTSVTIKGSKYTAITLANGAYSVPRGLPDLPSITKSIIIPDDKKMAIEILTCEYSEFPIEGIIPSQGEILRSQNPDTIPYTFDALYRRDTWYPQKIASLLAPYILRDFRGSLVQIFPFQYNPVKKTLRVYSKITLKVSAIGSSTENVLTRNHPIHGIDGEYSAIYTDKFINFDKNRYPVINEDGSMLIISHADFMSTLAPFVEWKKKKGLTVEVVDVATAGTSASKLHQYIKNYYTENKKLKYVLLVGDVQQVPTLLVNSKYGADTKFGQVAGTDIYADIFVSRFSGTKPEHIKNQIDKSYYYETAMKITDTWLSNVLLSASNDKKKNKWKETDADFINHEYDSLKKAGYTNVFRHNQKGVGGQGCVTGTAASCSKVINEGIAFWEYSDHGSKTSYPAVGFKTSHAIKLTNKNKYFYTYSVACNPGEFNTGTSDCLGEAFMKLKDGGTIGTFMGTLSQPWDPPYAALRDILFINCDQSPIKMVTLGGLMLNGGMSSYEKCPNTSGKNTYESFSLLGDPNLQVYSKTPSKISIKHTKTIVKGSQKIEITGTDNARVCLYNAKQSIQEVGIIRNGTLTRTIDVKTTDAIHITGMLRNHETYLDTIVIGATSINGALGLNARYTMHYANQKIIYHVPLHALSQGPCQVSLSIYNLGGQRVYSFTKELSQSGTHAIYLDQKIMKIGQGIYLAKISMNDFSKRTKIQINH